MSLTDIDPEIDAAFEAFVEEMAERNPDLFTDAKLKLPQDMFREILRTTYHLAYQAGATAAQQI